MLLTISTTHAAARDLGFLLCKHADRCQTFEESFGDVHVFYPEATEERCATAMLLGVEALTRFVRRDPLRRVHKCVFGVLALESEPLDPRL